VNIEAFIAILTVSVLIEKLTFAHLPEIVFVKIVASVSLLTESLQPMFTDIIIIVPTVVMLRLLGRCRVAVGTTSTSRTLTVRSEVRANRYC